MKKTDSDIATKLVRGGLVRSANQETSEALYMTSGFVYESAEQAAAAFREETDNFVYARYGNPTVSMFEDRLALLEGAEACKATGTGMAAVFAVMACQLESGDRIVASRALFGACYVILTQTLPKWGIDVELIDGTDPEAWATALQTPTKMVFFESPSNPLLELVDVAAVSEMAHAAGAMVVVDNVFATALHQRPLELGADAVIYSATKHIDGQGRLMGGAVLGDQAFIKDVFTPFYRQTGAAISAFNAWVMLKSLETLSLRVEAQCASAARIATMLAGHKAVKNVRYPGLSSHPQYDLACKQMSGFGSIIAFEIDGDEAAAYRALNQLSLIDISNNLGDSKSLACHPYTTTHSSLSIEELALLGISRSHIRLSIGLESGNDLINDIEQALSILR
ncbi:O-succinylhomoserine sulfhydrylase [Candidatus Puniceispirillum sp.]|uniref:O-succinylhomoserine sulfhydrylase n=1 Tax=Candidatus Puniceispirillum sp. TaxID=2026719 RepID=UPI003F69DACD